MIIIKRNMKPQQQQKKHIKVLNRWRGRRPVVFHWQPLEAGGDIKNASKTKKNDVLLFSISKNLQKTRKIMIKEIKVRNRWGGRRLHCRRMRHRRGSPSQRVTRCFFHNDKREGKKRGNKKEKEMKQHNTKRKKYQEKIRLWESLERNVTRHRLPPLHLDSSPTVPSIDPVVNNRREGSILHPIVDTDEPLALKLADPVGAIRWMRCNFIN